jgi:hypothetical protein
MFADFWSESWFGKTGTRVGLKVSGLTYKSRAECKMPRGIYRAIYGEVNVSVSVCVEIKGDYIEK